MSAASQRVVHEGTGRVGVTVEEYAKSKLNGENTAYLFSATAERLGLEPWEAVEGVDLHTDPAASHADVWTTSGHCRPRPLSSLLYVRPADLELIVAGNT